jgi:hypothetical protein
VGSGGGVKYVFLAFGDSFTVRPKAKTRPWSLLPQELSEGKYSSVFTDDQEIFEIFLTYFYDYKTAHTSHGV